MLESFRRKIVAIQETLIGKHIGFQAVCSGCGWRGKPHNFSEPSEAREAINGALGDLVLHQTQKPRIQVITDIGGTGGYVYHEVRIEKLRE